MPGGQRRGRVDHRRRGSGITIRSAKRCSRISGRPAAAVFRLKFRIAYDSVIDYAAMWHAQLMGPPGEQDSAATHAATLCRGLTTA